MPENLLSMQISHIRYTNMDFFKTPHIQIQLLGKDPVFKYEFLVLFIYPCCAQVFPHRSTYVQHQIARIHWVITIFSVHSDVMHR